jgi:hypothetical protein
LSASPSPGFCCVAEFELLAEDEVEMVEPMKGEPAHPATISASVASPARRIDLELDIRGHSFGTARKSVREVGVGQRSRSVSVALLAP